MASDVKYDVLENVNPDLSDSEFVDIEVGEEQGLDAPTPGFDAPTPAADAGADEDEDEGATAAAREEEDEAEGDIDEELAAELDLALGDEEGGADADEDEDEDDDDEEDESDEDDDDDDEAVQARKLLNEEIRDLEAAVNKKRTEIASSANPLIKVRFDCDRLLVDCETDVCDTAAVRGCAQEASSRFGHEDGAARRDEGASAAPQRGHHFWRCCRWGK